MDTVLVNAEGLAASDLINSRSGFDDYLPNPGMRAMRASYLA